MNQARVRRVCAGLGGNAGRVRLVGEKIRPESDLRIDLVVVGDDWRGGYDFLNEYCRVVYLTRTPGISTSDIRGRLSELCGRT